MGTIDELKSELRLFKIVITAIFSICLFYLTFHSEQGIFDKVCFLSFFGYLQYHFIMGYFETKRAIKFYQELIDKYKKERNIIYE
ncbi:TPA: hypothetical protein RPW15_001955 [Campylobacter fetus subsp. venerealis]|uniref:Uncharacterized protein n=3 Tax=Campylobacter TaxID=194 RepID=A0AAE6J051_CAMFE|nr:MULTISPECIES: hypothetical protein [Campylobacter]OCS29781.1 hypothetical protein CFVCCUG33900_05380 [Campylobacter fetus subsp. venerealis LMG 6570 = CCUG 33900]OCS40003.1 hypothetical protein CFVI02298_09215 [Campylobacter fetus subsp. venerealis cfvi02/298]AHE94532.1 hypothetical protein CFVI03293_1228 [Campylobacter fetus subsp. venerealis cfvi03/293]AIR80902.1 hypothetical protein CFV97608_1283 [Campylobacter fetus subsp. venerealis 97/608]EAI8859302.1 hypothetical protein [Campylobact